MFEVLYSKTDYDFLDQPSCDETEILEKTSLFSTLPTYNPTDLY